MDAFLWKSPSFSLQKAKRTGCVQWAKKTCSRSISVCLFHRAPDKRSLCCTCIMNARMRLQIHYEDDVIIYQFFPRSVWFNQHLQRQRNAGEELWENRQLSLQACNLASIDRSLHSTWTHTCKRKHPNSPQKSRAHTQTTENLRLLLTSLVCLLFEDRRAPKEEDEER